MLPYVKQERIKETKHKTKCLSLTYTTHKKINTSQAETKNTS